MAISSATSAAASTVLSGSKLSSDHLNRHLTSGSMLSSYPSHLTTTLSATAPFPTVTLDLTNHGSDRQSPFHFPFSTNMHSNINIPSRPQVYSDSPGMDTELMNAATTAVTSDPHFMAALVAAIGSIVGDRNRNNGGDINNMKDDDNFKRY